MPGVTAFTWYALLLPFSAENYNSVLTFLYRKDFHLYFCCCCLTHLESQFSAGKAKVGVVHCISGLRSGCAGKTEMLRQCVPYLSASVVRFFH